MRFGRWNLSSLIIRLFERKHGLTTGLGGKIFLRWPGEYVIPVLGKKLGNFLDYKQHLGGST